MRYRLIRIVVALAATAVPLLSVADPASAANGPPVVGCITGSSCMIELNYYVTYSGSSGGSNGVVVTPPPCIAVPVGDAHTGSQIIISLYGTTAPAPPTTTAPATPASSGSATATGTASATPTSSASASASPTSPSPSPTPPPPDLTPVQKQILDLAKTLVNSDPMTPGEWYQIAADPYATAAASQVCQNLPPYVWADKGKIPVLHGLHIPTRTLAELAYSQLTTPTVGTFKLNPKAANNDTNLPTFVYVVLDPPTLGVMQLTTQGHPYVYATAMAPDGTAATVYAVATGLNIDPGTSNANTYDLPECSVARPADSKNDGKYILGSREMASAGRYGAGQSIDCGVTYTSPGSYNLTVSVGWSACWARGTVNPGGPPADCNANIPGAAGLQDSTTGPIPVNVREIQSVNESPSPLPAPGLRADCAIDPGIAGPIAQPEGRYRCLRKGLSGTTGDRRPRPLAVG